MHTQNGKQELADAFHELIGREEAGSLNDNSTEGPPQAWSERDQAVLWGSIPHLLTQPITLFGHSVEKAELYCVFRRSCIRWWLAQTLTASCHWPALRPKEAPFFLPGNSKSAMVVSVLTRVIAKLKYCSHKGERYYFSDLRGVWCRQQHLWQQMYKKYVCHAGKERSNKKPTSCWLSSL